MTESFISLPLFIQIPSTLTAAWLGIAFSVYGAIAAITGNPRPPAPLRVAIALIIAAAGAALCAASLYAFTQPRIPNPLTIPAVAGALTFGTAVFAIKQSLPIARYISARGELPFGIYPNDYANSLDTPHDPPPFKSR